MGNKEEKRMLRVAINGFGRIGRMALRLLQDDKDVEVVFKFDNPIENKEIYN